MRFQNILFPTDFSDCSLVALDYARDLAEKFDGTLHMLSVVYDLSAPPGVVPFPASYAAMLADLESSAKSHVEKLASTVKGVKTVKTVVRKGMEDQEILRYAESEKIDLIVMGTHGRRGLEHLIIGSTAEKVIRRAKAPVLTIRKPG